MMTEGAERRYTQIQRVDELIVVLWLSHQLFWVTNLTNSALTLTTLWMIIDRLIHFTTSPFYQFICLIRSIYLLNSFSMSLYYITKVPAWLIDNTLVFTSDSLVLW